MKKGKNLSKQKATKELKPILEMIRFHNIDADGLQMVEKSYICTLIGESKFLKDYVYPAYKVHSQMVCIASPGRVQRSSNGNSEGECPCVAGDDCPHRSPRLYTAKPYGKEFRKKLSVLKSSPNSIGVIDRTNVKQCAKLQLGLEDCSMGTWTLKYGKTKQAHSEPSDER